jgi:hypothetical protein
MSTKKSRSRKSKNPWIEFTKKHRASVVSGLKKKKNYSDGKGQLKLQQDALKEMGKMYRERK